MKLQKSTRYALYAAAELARAGDGRQVTVSQVAERHGVPGAVLAKVFQQLVRAGVAVGTRGTRGGYHLARPPSRITLLDVIEVFEPSGVPGGCLLGNGERDECLGDAACDLRRVFDEVDELLRCTFASITLETLVGRRGPGREAG